MSSATTMRPIGQELAARSGPAVAPVPAGGRLARGTRHYFSGTPGRMRILGALAALACLAYSVTGIFGLIAVNDAVGRAGANTAQVVRAQAIYADLLKADASASNGFLVGGLETAGQRAAYDEAMHNVATTIAQAAQAQPADGTALAALNADVQAYAANIDQARAYNRQGLPVGAQYLKIASSGLRADALPIVTAIADANKERADTELGGAAHGVPVILVGVAVLGVLAAVGWWLARRTHRYLNLALAAAALIILGSLLAVFNAVSGVNDAMTKVRDGHYRAAVSLASARAAAYDAKANESLTLIARGSGAAFEKAYVASAKVVADEVAAAAAASTAQQGLTGDFGAYDTLHRKIRAADDSGQWDQAVTLATATVPGSANNAFTVFDDDVKAGLDTEVKDARAALGSADVPWLPWTVGICGIAGALLALRAMTKRIEEYR